MASIALSTESREGATIVSIAGSLDGSSVPLLLGQVEPLVEEGARVVLDFGAVDYVSSAGWGMVLHTLSRGEQKHGAVVLCRMQPGIMRTFELLKLNTVFRHFGTVEDAVKSFL